MTNHQGLVKTKNLLQARMIQTMVKIIRSIKSIRLVCQVVCQIVTLVQQKMQTIILEEIVQSQDC